MGYILQFYTLEKYDTNITVDNVLYVVSILNIKLILIILVPILKHLN